MDRSEFETKFAEITSFKQNRFHMLVWILGEPQIGEGVSIGGMSEVNAKGAKVVIADLAHQQEKGEELATEIGGAFCAVASSRAPERTWPVVMSQPAVAGP